MLEGDMALPRLLTCIYRNSATRIIHANRLYILWPITHIKHSLLYPPMYGHPDTMELPFISITQQYNQFILDILLKHFYNIF